MALFLTKTVLHISMSLPHWVLQEYNDALLTVLLSSLTKGSNQMLDYVDKVNLAYSRP